MPAFPQDPWTRLSRHLDMDGGPDACWEWTGYRDPLGYGMTALIVDGTRKTMKAHRAVYLTCVGDVPAGLFLLHSCDNPPCCNPAHLRPGTQIENMHDRKTRGAGYPKGAQVYNALQLDDGLVATIRAEYRPRDREFGTPGLARKYGLSRTSVQKIVSRTERWAS
jgi:hypothetical protein